MKRYRNYGTELDPYTGSGLQVRASGANEAEILLYDVIGQDFWSGGGITGKDIAEKLKALGDVSRILLRINSPGGDVFEGTTIFNLLKGSAAQVDVMVDGLAASAASLIAMAGKTITMAENAMLMIHNPWSIAVGDANEMRKQAGVLDKVGEAMATSYVTRSGKPAAEVRAIMDAETWYTAADAKAAGWADAVGQPVPVRASFDMAKMGFKNLPETLKTAPVSTETEAKADKKADEPAKFAPVSIRRRQLDLAERA